MRDILDRRRDPVTDFPPLQPGKPAVAPGYFDWIRNSTYTEYRKRWSIRERYPNMQVPVLHIGPQVPDMTVAAPRGTPPLLS
ncbi:hypothetical protein NBRGN_068_00490 [Nocardia brasiliensis NBRC 14402]|uniref:hypothetical protein n=1 Tax=Nocardia brasiliensis TaxID=37326 RepID=UPI0002F0D90C|nr:hypothetical protein [Nocardia brasiliensis]ASF06692.1 hypothetical protein CEQ30_04365 [Nocardia brasiliensis]GAJ84057.1 hypothetical protein NBRGN_068_00490 [Nocardia brasiliensis NBRC 14402]SUB48130.1 Uncharacterised protein [Nocardia brasiliensis]